MIEHVNLFSFSGIYNEENFWRELSDDGSRLSGMQQATFGCCTTAAVSAGLPLFNSYDFTELGGTNGYLSEESAAVIRAELSSLPDAACLNFIDSGNTHYMTMLLSERVEKPYILVLIDHHPDMLPPAFGGLLSCGSWVRAALLEDKNLVGVLMIGVDEALAQEAVEDDVAETMFAGKPVLNVPESAVMLDPAAAVRTLRAMAGIRFISSAASEANTTSAVPESIPVYISLDKDVLMSEAVSTNWDQGEMMPEALFAILEDFCAAPDIEILGADICGECSPAAFYGDYTEFSRHLEQNDEINAKLLDILTKKR